MSLELGQRVPELELVDPRGQRVAISRYWQRQPAVFFFVRHLG